MPKKKTEYKIGQKARALMENGQSNLVHWVIPKGHLVNSSKKTYTEPEWCLKGKYSNWPISKMKTMKVSKIIVEEDKEPTIRKVLKNKIENAKKEGN